MVLKVDILSSKMSEIEATKRLLKKHNVEVSQKKTRKTRQSKNSKNTTNTNNTPNSTTSTLGPTASSTTTTSSQSQIQSSITLEPSKFLTTFNENNQSNYNQFPGYQPLEEKIDTLDWGFSSWGNWGSRQLSLDHITDDHPPTIQILNDESYNECSNPSILRKKTSKKRKSGDIFDENSNHSGNSNSNSNTQNNNHNINHHQNSNDSTNILNNGHGILISHINEQSNNNLNDQIYPNFPLTDENSMLIPIFDEFSMM